MKDSNSTTSNQQDSAINTANNNTKNIKAVRKLKVLTHILYNSQGVSEKTINSGDNVMSGRNYPTHLQRKHNILLASPIFRAKDKEGSPYSVYQLLNTEQAHKLVDLIIHHCKRYKLTSMNELAMRSLADNFPNRGEVSA